jgi:hypothetical protein
MENLWDLFKKVAEEKRQQYTYLHIPFANPEMDPLEVYGSYFRITLSQMFLTQARKWFINLYPAAHASVRMQYANYDAIELMYITPVPEQKDLSQGIPLNFSVTNLIPWNGGTLEIAAGLISLQGPDRLKGALDVLGTFSSLVAAPVSQAITVAGKIATSAQQFMVGNSGAVEFTFHQTYTDISTGNLLRPGYYAAVLGTEAELKGKRFTVESDQLQANGKDFTDFSYLLFRIDGVKERADWRMKNIQNNINKARDSYRRRDVPSGDGFLNAALVEVDDSQELSYADKNRIEALIRNELEPLRKIGLGAAGSDDPRKSYELDDLRKNAISWEKAMEMGPKTRPFG